MAPPNMIYHVAEEEWEQKLTSYDSTMLSTSLSHSMISA